MLDLEFLKKYSDFINELIDSGQRKKVPNSEQNFSLTFYWPHQGLYKQDSSTTKLQVDLTQM